MKRHLTLLAAVLLLTTSGFAFIIKQKQDTPPAAAKAAFTKAFPGSSKVKWEKEKEGFEASFVQNGKKMSAVYDAQGNLKETEAAIKASELPAGVMDYVKKHYKGASIKETAKITDAAGNVKYEVGTSKEDLYFDTNGKFLSSSKESD